MRLASSSASRDPVTHSSTHSATSTGDIVCSLDAGSDDYLTKPFALDVLLARVRAAARRVPAPLSQALQYADLILRAQQYEMQREERVEILTRTECALLETLIRRAQSLAPHEVLIDSGWGADANVSYDSLYVFIRALRSKITRSGEPELLHTVRGVGYSLLREFLPCRPIAQSGGGQRTGSGYRKMDRRNSSCRSFRDQ